MSAAPTAAHATAVAEDESAALAADARKRQSPRLVPAAAPAAVEAAPQAAPQAAPAKQRRPGRMIVLGAVLLAALCAAGWYGYNWFAAGRFEVSTNDAYVRTDISQIGAKVAGYVVSIPAPENTHVQAGDVLLTLDSGDYQLAVDAAQQRIATQQATIAGFASQHAAQQAQIAVAESKVTSAKTEVTAARATLDRVTPLVRTRIAAPQRLDDTAARVDTANANLLAAQAGVQAAKAQLDVITASQTQAERVLAELETSLKKAQRDLSFSQVIAPFAGTVANRAVEPGQFVQPGQRLMALLPDNAAYIEANYKETQIADVHVGQKAKIEIDAFGGKVFEGVVTSVAPASGAEFSLLPPENATGNFTKITQRIPVHVSVPPELAAKLAAGLSVTVTIDSRDGGTAN